MIITKISSANFYFKYPSFISYKILEDICLVRIIKYILKFDYRIIIHLPFSHTWKFEKGKGIIKKLKKK